MLVFEEVAPLEQQGSAHVNYLFRAKLTKEAEQVLALGAGSVNQRVVVKFSKGWLLSHLEREAAAICQHQHPNLLLGYAPRDTSQGFLLRGFDPTAFLRYLSAKGWTREDLSQALVMERLALVSEPDVLAVPLSSFEGVLFGSTSGWRLPPKGLLPEAYLRFVRALCLQAFRAVAYVHQQTPPLIHGDLKPNNFLLRGSLERGPEALTASLSAHPDLVKLIDFGLQREEGKAASHSFGVPYYLAPECLTEAGRGQRGRLHAAASDVWALGFTLCFLFFRDLAELRTMLGMGFDWKNLRSRLVERFQERGLTGLLADLWSRMLAPLPEHRPLMQEVVTLAEAYAWDSREPLAALHPYILETKPLPSGLPEALQGWLPLLLQTEAWEKRFDASALLASQALLRVEGMERSLEESQRAFVERQQALDAARKDAATARQEAVLAQKEKAALLEAVAMMQAQASLQEAQAAKEGLVAVRSEKTASLKFPALPTETQSDLPPAPLHLRRKRQTAPQDTLYVPDKRGFGLAQGHSSTKRRFFAGLLLLLLGVVALIGLWPVALPPLSSGCREFNAGGSTFQACPIPAGSFTMGSPDTEKQRDGDEGLQRMVTISRPFWVMATEVTQGQFKALMGYNPSNFSSCGNTCPVEQVSWNEAAAFANALSAKQGKDACFTCEGSEQNARCSAKDASGYVACRGWRLPTEAEWEYVARAGTTSRFHTGDCITAKEANFDGRYPADGCPNGESRGKTLPVGSLAKNGWGLFDVHGNVWEWVYDFYQGSYTGFATENPTGSGYALSRVFRGGSWFNEGQDLRAANRGGFSPSDRNHYLGFRLSTLAL